MTPPSGYRPKHWCPFFSTYLSPPTFVPPAGAEHVNIHYDEASFRELGPCETTVFPCRGWSEYGFKLWYHIFFWNILRRMLGRPLRPRKMQILFHLGQAAPVAARKAGERNGPDAH